MHIHMVDQGGVLVIVPLIRDPVEMAAGFLAGEAAWGKALLASRKKEAGDAS